MLRIGLTGGIGSGKTLVSNRLAENGIAVIDADCIAHQLTRPDTASTKEIIHALGDDLRTAKGGLDRELLRKRIFAQTEKRRTLEGILHPRIIHRIQEQVQAITGNLCVIVIPLLAEHGLAHMVDRILVIEAPQRNREEWLHNRSGLVASEAIQIMSHQASSIERLAIADDVLFNDRTKEILLRKVDYLTSSYQALSS